VGLSSVRDGILLTAIDWLPAFKKEVGVDPRVREINPSLIGNRLSHRDEDPATHAYESQRGRCP
jgi:hypothetical protein